MTPDGSSTEKAREVLADALTRRPDPDLESLCASRPELAEKLRQVAGEYQRAEELLDQLGVPPLESGRSDGEHVARELEQEIAALAPARDLQELIPLEPLSESRSSEVSKVWDPRLRRAVVLKRLKHSLRAADELGRRRARRFLDEARIAGRLDHPSILGVHEIGIDLQGHAFYCMPYVAGREFRDVIRDVHNDHAADWTQARALRLLARISEAVSYAHSKGVVHRDLKPSNVLIGRFGEVFVMDWGLAKLLDSEEEPWVEPAEAGAIVDGDEIWIRSGSLRTREGEVLGTPAYMAPEQASGHREQVGVRSDVFALGAMLYHLLGGRRPYAEELGGSSSASEVIERVRSTPPRVLNQIEKGIAPELLAICGKAMAREPSARYAQAMELADDLSAFLDGRIVSVQKKSLLTRVRKWAGRNRILATTLTVSVLGGVFGTAAYLHSQAESQRALEATNANLRATSYAHALAVAYERVRNEDPRARDVLDSVDPALRGWEWEFLARAADPSLWTADLDSYITVQGDEIYSSKGWDLCRASTDIRRDRVEPPRPPGTSGDRNLARWQAGSERRL